MNTTFTLLTLGWQPYFQQQLSLADLESNQIARICSCHHDHYELVSEAGLSTLALEDDIADMIVGDWVITNTQGSFIRRLERSSSFENNAANIDTVLIVFPLDQELNIPLVKRYLELTNEAQADAVVVLTKADICNDTNNKRAIIERLDSLLIVETVNAKDKDSLVCLEPALKKGKTIALLGSAGAGKSTLINTLMTSNTDYLPEKIGQDQAFQTMPQGAILLDTQRLRDLQVAQYTDQTANGFTDIIKLAQDCRFNDCHHQGEPGCAIKKAVEENRLDAIRFEQFMVTFSIEDGDDQQKSKPQAKFYRSAQSDVRARKHSSVE